MRLGGRSDTPSSSSHSFAGPRFFAASYRYYTSTLTALVFSGRAVGGCALARAPKTMSTAHRDPLRAHSVRRALLADGDGADGWWNDAHDQVRCAVPPRFFSARAPSRASTVPS